MNLIPDKEEPNRLFVSTKSETIQRIGVTLVGTRSNRDGVGALIAVVGADGVATRVTRWVMRSSGFNSSLPRQQVIGLGNRSGPYSVTVTWPSGTLQSITGVNSGDAVVITETTR